MKPFVYKQITALKNDIANEINQYNTIYGQTCDIKTIIQPFRTTDLILSVVTG